ncbi:MAG: ATP-binding protein [Acidimicrobiales bacterium]|nr:ATP-binding protein [Acidimicrobiales bacterium]
MTLVSDPVERAVVPVWPPDAIKTRDAAEGTHLRTLKAGRARSWSVQRVVVALAALTFTPLVLLTAAAIVLSSRAVTSEALLRVESAARLEARAVSVRLDALRNLARSLAIRPTLVAALANGAVSEDDLGALQQQLDLAIESDPGFASVGIVDPTGRLLAVTPATPAIVGVDFSLREWFKGASRAADTYVSGGVVSATGDHPLVVSITTPIWASAEATAPVVGYLSLGYELTAVQDYVAEFAHSEGVVFTVADQHGAVLAGRTRPTSLDRVAAGSPLAKAAAGRSGAQRVDLPEGSVLAGFAPVEGVGWGVEAAVPRSQALARVASLRVAVGGISLALAAAISVGLVVVARLWRRRTVAERELAAVTINLERSNDELEQFAYIASHDLSEPLRAISGPISLVARRYRGQLDPESDKFIDFAVDGCRRMQVMIDDLLEYSRVGRTEAAPALVDIAAVMERVTASLSAAIRDAGAEVAFGELPTVVAERGQVDLVFQNLVANALKFVAPDVTPRVSVSAERVGREWRFIVTDNGIGIEPQHRERVFGMFKRLHTRDEYGGTGLGLALVKKIVERHGGRVGIADNPGGGSQFWFTLPTTEENHDRQ